jgi:hypothetical protein
MFLAVILAACATVDETARPTPISPLDLLPIDGIRIEAEIAGTRASLNIARLGPPLTAICGDDWYSYSQRQRGTCSGHRGVKEWRNQPN